MNFTYQTAKLVSHSAGVFSPGSVSTPQELVAYCARVSNPANQNNLQTSEKLVRYLVKHKHWSPLEMVSATVEVETTRDIARQMLRHRSFSFQEFSQRYADPTSALDFVTRDARLQDLKNRQNSVETDDALLLQEWERRQTQMIVMARNTYAWAIEHGIAKEQARAILPEGCTMSRIYMAGTLRSFVHYVEVRTANGTQAEHMDVARKIALAIAPVFPLISDFVAAQPVDAQQLAK